MFCFVFWPFSYQYFHAFRHWIRGRCCKGMRMEVEEGDQKRIHDGRGQICSAIIYIHLLVAMEGMHAVSRSSRPTATLNELVSCAETRLHLNLCLFFNSKQLHLALTSTFGFLTLHLFSSER